MPRRTNNDQEIFHRHLNTIMNSPRPGIWHFTKTLVKIEQEYGTRYERMQSRPALRARRRAYVQIDKKISEATERLAQGRISVKEFLLYTGHLAYDAERRRGVGNVGIVPPQIVETIEEQIPTVNVEDNVVGGFDRQNELRELILQQQNRIREMAEEQDNALNIFNDEPDFVLAEDDDPVFIAMAEIEEQRRAQDRENIPHVPLDINGVEPRPADCCVICLSNVNSHACIPCGHKCLCRDCLGNLIHNRCPICNIETTLIVQIF
ncbi:uncharacterized protein LOC132950680 [Metopolophium dirhodum]|uniref:uncharacterized protein LOC132950680 n=1 Tax=Metopolophium dirhodum TaxID=44670 RepID=UPI00298F7CF9|nr:uncharacterized protein LOC132950680 [Metopolophium dirhodum]